MAPVGEFELPGGDRPAAGTRGYLTVFSVFHPPTCPGISAWVLDTSAGEPVSRALTPAAIELSLTATGAMIDEPAYGGASLALSGRESPGAMCSSNRQCDACS